VSFEHHIGRPHLALEADNIEEDVAELKTAVLLDSCG
jgi:hypothetical protein